MFHFTDSCGYESMATHVSKQLVTPNYPLNYPAFVNCEWNLKAPVDEQILLVIVSGKSEVVKDVLQVCLKSFHDPFVKH